MDSLWRNLARLSFLNTRPCNLYHKAIYTAAQGHVMHLVDQSTSVALRAATNWPTIKGSLLAAVGSYAAGLIQQLVNRNGVLFLYDNAML